MQDIHCLFTFVFSTFFVLCYVYNKRGEGKKKNFSEGVTKTKKKYSSLWQMFCVWNRVPDLNIFLPELLSLQISYNSASVELWDKIHKYFFSDKSREYNTLQMADVCRCCCWYLCCHLLLFTYIDLYFICMSLKCVYMCIEVIKSASVCNIRREKKTEKS